MASGARQRWELRAWYGAAALAVLGAGAAFWAPGLRAAHQSWPVPLDDVYIHFDFARSAALGHPLEWIPGNGYSSGATSLLYPFVLAPAYLFGARGAWLGVFAAVLAVACLVDLCLSMRRLLGRGPGWSAWAIPAFVVGVPLLDWSWFSGMETALVGAVLGRTLCAIRVAEDAAAERRSGAQWKAGLWSAVLVAARPETAALVVPLGVAVAHASGSRSPLAALARAWTPTLTLLALQASVNRALTTEWSAAGAVRKLLVSDPFATPLQIAAEVARNLAVLRAQAFETALGGRPWAFVPLGLALVAVLDRRTRRIASALLVGALGCLALVCLNATARFQNLRYAAPSLAMLMVASALGLGALARRGRFVGALGAGAAAMFLVSAARELPRQTDHFARASRNIVEQQVEVGRRLAALQPTPRRVLVGDAGAIPYVSGLPAIDGLGLGGYRGLPFARASVHGVPAVLELLERLEPAERPDVMALYPSWWSGLADVFGRRLDAVRIVDNVICAADEKVLYAADWSAFDRAPGSGRDGLLDRLDVADLVDEQAHAYEPPTPAGGWPVAAVLALPDGTRRFDAGRIVPEGRSESFRVAPGVPRGPAALVLRTDAGEAVSLEVTSRGSDEAVRRLRLEVPERPAGRWFEARVDLGDTQSGDRITLTPVRGAWRTFTAWIVRR